MLFLRKWALTSKLHLSHVAFHELRASHDFSQTHRPPALAFPLPLSWLLGARAGLKKRVASQRLELLIWSSSSHSYTVIIFSFIRSSHRRRAAAVMSILRHLLRRQLLGKRLPPLGLESASVPRSHAVGQSLCQCVARLTYSSWLWSRSDTLERSSSQISG